MTIECPGCGGQYEVAPQYIGQKLKCPDCENEFEVQNPNLMPCPDCFRQISKRAGICPHCGAMLSDTAAPDKKSGSHFHADTENISAEKEILVCHPSAMNYFWAIGLGVITTPIFLGILILLYVWIEIHYTSYRITTMRIVVRRGWIAKLQNEIWIKDMRGANLNQGIWQRIIGVGTISIGTAATAGAEICMNGIADPQFVVDKINALRH